MIVIAYGLLTTVANATEVTLAWNSVTDPDLDHYTLYQADRFGDKTGAWTPVKTVEAGINTTSLTVMDGVNFAWYVTASDRAGNESGPSNMVELYDRTPPRIPTDLVKAEPKL